MLVYRFECLFTVIPKSETLAVTKLLNVSENDASFASHGCTDLEVFSLKITDA